MERFGPYVVHERLGAGGMATVHRAIKTGIEGFERPVALKRLLSQYAGDDEFVKSFVREARLASRLQHPNIAQTFDLGRVEYTYFIAMELVDGVDLRRVLQRLAEGVGPMPVPLVLQVMIQVCEALEYAHGFEIVHRDVSPSNLIVGRDGVVKIIDFGIAKASSATLHTASGVLKGKFSYMAPETLEGRTDARSDLFAVGVVMHELLTARPLWVGRTDFETLELVLRVDAPAPSTINPAVPPEVDQVVLTALAKNPTQRWQTAAQLRNALAALAERPGLRATTLDLTRWLDATTAPASAPAALPQTIIAEPPTLAAASAPLPATVIDLGPTLYNPLASAEYQEAAARYNQMATVVALPSPVIATTTPPTAAARRSLSIVLVLILCVVAAVGGFFLVDALM